eukprot:6868835-Karenia_brevis.AAC.1
MIKLQWEHMGLPIRRYGFSSSILLIAWALISAWLKSHGLPNSSVVNMSMLDPPINPLFSAT